MKLEKGKQYVTRSGIIATIIDVNPDKGVWKILGRINQSTYTWASDGRYNLATASDMDLVSEYNPEVKDHCNKVQRDGNCDASEWIECTYCGAIDLEPCRGVPRTTYGHNDYLRGAIKKIKAGQTIGLHPSEQEALIVHMAKILGVV
jgi:hypothetical protein